MDNVQKPGQAHDCAVCEHFRRGIAAADAMGNGSLASDGRVLLARHQKAATGDGPWAPVEPAYSF
ncbi:hypothetical protein [Streptacidiphilus rugosus]|uniref:hypothetical protein n=1 Tax=Streptacidiphilus rugosus TaxID=405783 RepID=UPI0012FAB8FF|nr:hypothetical protein [Streptacidiphilus rugosus]